MRTGPDELWTLVRLDRPCAEALASSCGWMYRWMRATCDLTDPDLDWSAWTNFMHSQPARFKGWAMRAQALEVRCYPVIAASDGLYGALRAC